MEIDLPSAHARALFGTGIISSRTDASQLGLPTPCEGWDVATLLNHIVAGNFWVEPLVAGQTIDEVGDRLDGDLLGSDHHTAFSDSAHAAATAFQGEGAMDVMVSVSYGPVPGSVYCGHRLIDVLVHGWDLAVATGQSDIYDLPDDLVEACWQVVEPQLADLEQSGAYGKRLDVPAGASTMTKLLASMGRTDR
jgi:uncharacterized protein (TIGR03086 family)